MVLLRQSEGLEEQRRQGELDAAPPGAQVAAGRGQDQVLLVRVIRAHLVDKTATPGGSLSGGTTSLSATGTDRHHAGNCGHLFHLVKYSIFYVLFQDGYYFLCQGYQLEP